MPERLIIAVDPGRPGGDNTAATIARVVEGRVEVVESYELERQIIQRERQQAPPPLPDGGKVHVYRPADAIRADLAAAQRKADADFKRRRKAEKLARLDRG